MVFPVPITRDRGLWSFLQYQIHQMDDRSSMLQDILNYIIIDRHSPKQLTFLFIMLQNIPRSNWQTQEGAKKIEIRLQVKKTQEDADKIIEEAKKWFCNSRCESQKLKICECDFAIVDVKQVIGVYLRSKFCISCESQKEGFIRILLFGKNKESSWLFCLGRCSSVIVR